MRDRLSLLWIRLQDVPWRRIALGSAITVALIAAIPPLRRAAAEVTGRAILVAVSPFAPSIRGFDALPQASKVLAADGTEVGRLGAEERHPVELRRLPP